MEPSLDQPKNDPQIDTLVEGLEAGPAKEKPAETTDEKKARFESLKQYADALAAEEKESTVKISSLLEAIRGRVANQSGKQLSQTIDANDPAFNDR